MGSVTAVRGTASCSNSFGMCTSMRPSSKSRSFYRYKIGSHLFIPLALEPTCSQALAQKHCLTPVLSALPKNTGGGPLRQKLPLVHPACAQQGRGERNEPLIVTRHSSSRFEQPHLESTACASTTPITPFVSQPCAIPEGRGCPPSPELATHQCLNVFSGLHTQFRPSAVFPSGYAFPGDGGDGY